MRFQIPGWKTYVTLRGPCWVKTSEYALCFCIYKKISLSMYLFDTLQGCVYVKCDTHHSAGLAFRSLHGCWFDGKSICCSALFKKQTYGEQIVSGTWLCTRGIFSQPTFSPCFCYSGEIHDIRFAIFRSKILWPIKNCQVLGTAIFTPIPCKTPWILFALSCTNPGQMNHDVLQHFCCSTGCTTM